MEQAERESVTTKQSSCTGSQHHGGCFKGIGEVSMRQGYCGV